MDQYWRERIRSLLITEHLERITSGIERHRCTILEAPPGSGKTTVVPLALHEQEWLAGKKILVLQPRRIATKGVASRMAELLGEEVGETIGYRIRLENRVSKRTRIEILTEGLLTKRIIADPELADVGAIIFDEFHERSVQADIGLALSLEVSSVLRSDLRIIVMSATLGESLPATLFEDAWRYTFQGAPHPVSISYRSQEQTAPLWERVARVVRESAERHEGDILVFLPGSFEIERTRACLEQSRLNALILPLYGELPYAEQLRAILPNPSGVRKVVLSTPIAETSLTIEGVRIIIDSGLHKVARTDTRGLTKLRTERITKDAAEQRAGRAGRTAPGVCLRLWSESEHGALRPTREPEVLRADLTSTILDLAVWGAHDPGSFAWITPPPEAAISAARRILLQLGAITEHGVTPLGRTLAQLGTDPRLGLMIIQARRYSLEDTAAALIPLLEERDILSYEGHGVRIVDRIEALNYTRTHTRNNSAAIERVRSLKQRWLKRMTHLPQGEPLPPSGTTVPPGSEAGFLLAIAFPERIGRRREPGSHKYLLSSGSAAALRDGDSFRDNEFIVVASLHDGREDGRIFLAAPLHPQLFEGPLEHLLSRERIVSFDQERGALLIRVVQRLGALTIREETHHQGDPLEMREALLSWLASEEGFARLPFSTACTDLQQRVAWARATHPHANIPDISAEALRATIATWLPPYMPERATLATISQELLDTAIGSMLPWEIQRHLDNLAPCILTLPGGRVRRLRYDAGSTPILEATIQELFGWKHTPTIGPSKIPITLHILSPARRPMQVTQDLMSFWRATYPQVRKELRGRYPKHSWPEDPLCL